jgi:molybdenum cofactor cytidylyltransferase
MTAMGAVVLAAGAGTRMGGVAKALLEEDGETFLRRIVRFAREAGVGEIVVVVGPPHGQRVAAHARELGVNVVENPAPERGMASSIAIGFAAIAQTECGAAFLWPVDHPHVSVETLRAIAGALGDHAVVRPVVDGRGGHPPLVTRAVFAQLAACGDLPEGARAVLRSVDTLDLPVQDRGCVRDIDTPEDR